MPLDAVYGMLRAMGANVPEDPAELEKALFAEAERFAKILAEREAIASPDAEIVRLTALADRAELEGLLLLADSFRERAKVRYLELEPTLEEQEDAVRQRFIEGAAVFARSAETKTLAFDHLAAAHDYAEAFDRVENRDAQLAWQYKRNEAIALTYHGDYRGDDEALEQAIATGKRALSLVSRQTSPLDWALIQIDIGIASQILGGRDTGSDRLEQAPAQETPTTRLPNPRLRA